MGNIFSNNSWMNVFFDCVELIRLVPPLHWAAFLSQSNVLTIPRIEKKEKKFRGGMLCVLSSAHKLFCLLLMGSSPRLWSLLVKADPGDVGHSTQTKGQLPGLDYTETHRVVLAFPKAPFRPVKLCFHTGGCRNSPFETQEGCSSKSWVRFVRCFGLRVQLIQRFEVQLLQIKAEQGH